MAFMKLRGGKMSTIQDQGLIGSAPTTVVMRLSMMMNT